MRRLRHTLALIVILILATAALVSAETFRFTSTTEYEVGPEFLVRVTNTSGDITISAGTGTKAVVEVVKEVRAGNRAEAEELEEELQAIIEQDDNSLEIDTRYPRWQEDDTFWQKLFDLRKGSFGTVHYHIELPEAAKLDLHSVSGDVSVRGITGSLRIEATSGDLEVADHTGDCSIKNTSGDISMRGIEGFVDLSSTSADILLDDVKGEVELRSTSGDSEVYWVVGNLNITKTSGDLRVEDCSGDIDIKTTSGDIYVSQEEGALFVSSSSGDVRIRSQVRNGERFEVETISGDITFEVPAEMEGEIKLETNSGTIESELVFEASRYGKRKVEGRIGANGPRLELSSSSGDISLVSF
ncbi:MAG: DUF4097 family beta strand repeat-containing protein [bacterium]